MLGAPVSPVGTGLSPGVEGWVQGRGLLLHVPACALLQEPMGRTGGRAVTS